MSSRIGQTKTVRRILHLISVPSLDCDVQRGCGFSCDLELHHDQSSISKVEFITMACMICDAWISGGVWSDVSRRNWGNEGGFWVCICDRCIFERQLQRDVELVREELTRVGKVSGLLKIENQWFKRQLMDINRMSRASSR